MIEKNIYDDINPGDYDKRQGENPIEEYQYNHWHPLISSAIEKYSKNAIVLDLGSGTGKNCFEMIKYAKKVFGIDSSKRMVDYAKQKYSGIEFICEDATDTSIQNNFIDAIFSFGLFEYVDKKRLIKEIHRVLKSSGVCVILAPNRYSFPRFLYFAVYRILGKKRVCSEPSFRQMTKMFRNFGFEIVDYKMDDGLFFLPGKLSKYIFGKKSWLFVERFFKNFKRNPFSMNMFFIIKKK